MFFTPIIESWGGPAELADAVSLPVKNVRRWADNDSIPAEWFAAVARAARQKGLTDITVAHLADTAERKRLARSAVSAESAAA